MKLIEKKCPSCGAGLKFDDNATSIVCEYCNQTFYIQKDEKKYSKLDTDHLGDAYKFVDEVGVPFIKGFAVGHAAIAIVAITFFIVIIVFAIFGFSKPIGLFKQNFTSFEQFVSDESVNSSESDDDSKFVTKLSDIDSVSFETFYDSAKSIIHHMDNKDYTVGEWSSVGSYLLTSKDGNENYLYTVMKHTYTHRKNKKKVTLYAAVKYSDLILNEKNVVNHSFGGTAISKDIDLDGNTHNWAEGYESVEKFYNHELRSQVGEYNIEATKGMYLEN